MNLDLNIRLPLPAYSGNNQYEGTGKRKHLKKKQVLWRWEVKRIIEAFMRDNNLRPIINYHHLYAEYHYKNKVKRDVGGVTKALNDVLEKPCAKYPEKAGLITNDCICSTIAAPFYPSSMYKGGCIILMLMAPQAYFPNIDIGQPGYLFKELDELDYSLGYPRLKPKGKKNV